MKCVILAGGRGTRISELSKSMPKPMIKILGKPIIFRIIMHYYKFGFKEFIIAAGYKKNFIKNYFKKNKFKDLKIKVIDTGLNTMTGGRLKRLKKYLKNETFMLTYGDGLSNVNIKKLVNFHKKHKKIGTLTAVRPPARFGAIRINGNRIKYFKEKSKLDVGWINGGFFVFDSKIFEFIKGDNTYLEREPLQNIGKKGELYAFKYGGFWQCMDTIRDKQIIEESLRKKKL